MSNEYVSERVKVKAAKHLHLANLGKMSYFVMNTIALSQLNVLKSAEIHYKL